MTNISIANYLFKYDINLLRAEIDHIFANDKYYQLPKRSTDEKMDLNKMLELLKYLEQGCSLRQCAKKLKINVSTLTRSLLKVAVQKLWSKIKKLSGQLIIQKLKCEFNGKIPSLRTLYNWFNTKVLSPLKQALIFKKGYHKKSKKVKEPKRPKAVFNAHWKDYRYKMQTRLQQF